MSEQKLLVDLNLNGNQIKNVLVDVVASDPPAPVEGQAWFNSTTHQLKYRDNTASRIIAIDGALTSASFASAALTTDLDASAGSNQLATASAIKTFIGNASVNQTGFTSFDGSGDYYSIAGGNLTLLRAAHGRVHGEVADCSAGQSVALTAHATNYVYFGTDGVLRVTTAATGQMYDENVFLFQAMTDGTNYGVVFENHPADFPMEVAHFAHHTIGAVIGLAPGSLTVGADCARVTTGTGGTATDRQIKIVGSAGFYDHGITNTIPDSAGAAVPWYQTYTDASGFWNMYAYQNSLSMYWNNAGTPTVLTVNKYSVYGLYCTKHDPNTGLPVYIAIMGNVEYGNLSAAQSAIADGIVPVPTNELARWELGKLGYAIIQNNASGGQIIEIVIQKQTLNAAYAGGGNVGSAALVTVNATGFTYNLSVADVTVQVAMETLDAHNHGLTTQQWGYLGGLDQGLSTTDSPKFNNLSIGVSSAGHGIDININKFIAFYPSTLHQPGNAGALGIIIDDGGGACGLKVENTHDGTYSSQEVSIHTSHGGVSVATECFRVDKDNNVSIGKASIPTTATNGFAYIPSCAGTPTGTPTSKTGFAPICIDETNNLLYFYTNGAWRSA